MQIIRVEGNYIFIIKTSDFSAELKALLRKIKPNCKIIEINYLTEGTVSSILLARELINNQEELITTNCDQRTEFDFDDFLYNCRKTEIDGCVVTYPYNNIIIGEKSPYSFIKLDKNGFAEKFEEKTAISEHALCGIHYWKKGEDFIKSAEELIKNNDRVNNEFYVAKTYNYMIKYNKKVVNYPIKSGEFYSLGTPEDLANYKKIKGLSDENF
jgi:NDP-sugar pyrophosphorylase family protein